MLAPHLTAPRRRPALPLAFALALATCFTTHLRTPACVYAAEPTPASTTTAACAPIAARTGAAPADAQDGVWLTLSVTEPSHDARVEEAVPPAPNEYDEAHDGWRTVCRRPCGVWVSPGARLRVNGDFPASPAFRVPSYGASAIVVRTTPPPPGALGMPIGLIAASASVLAISSALLLMHSSGHATDYKSEDDRRAGQRFERNLAIASGVSLGGVLSGVAWLLLARHTDVSVDTATTGSPSQAPTSAASPVGVTSDGTRPLSIAIGHGLSVSPDGVHF